MLQEDARNNDTEVALSRLIVVHEELRGARVVHVLSDVDVYTSAEFEREVAWAFSGGLLVVNLLDCRYADSTAIEVLLRAHERLGTNLRLVVPGDGPLRLIVDVLKLSNMMFVVTSVEEAMKPLLCGAPEQGDRPHPDTARDLNEGNAMLEFESHEPAFRTERLGHFDTIRVAGEIDLSNVPRLRELIGEVASGNTLVVDLSECTYLDSSVLGVLSQTHRSHGERLIVVVPLDARIRKIFQITGLDRALDIRPDLDGI